MCSPIRDSTSLSLRAWISRSLFLRSRIRYPTIRLSSSNWVSPGPRIPIPAAIRERCVHILFRRGKAYISWASSTWSRDSIVLARVAKISRINSLRSKTLTFVAFSRFRIWAGDSSLSNITTSASVIRTCSCNS